MMWWIKPRNHFEDERDQNFSQICLGDEISWKLRQFWIEAQHKVYDKLNKGGKNLNFELENPTISYPCEPGTSTYWQNWIWIKPHLKTHLPARSVSLAHLQACVWKLVRVYAPKLDKLGSLSSIIPIKSPKIYNLDWGSHRTVNQVPVKADITAFWKKLILKPISHPSQAR